MHKCLCARIHTHTHKGKIRMLKNKRSFTGEPNGLVLSSEQFYNIPWPCGILDWLWFHSSYWLGKRSNLKASNDSTLANTWMRLLSWWSGCFPEQDREGVRVPCSLKCLESRLEISSLLFLNILPNHQKWSLYSEKKWLAIKLKMPSSFCIWLKWHQYLMTQEAWAVQEFLNFFSWSWWLYSWVCPFSAE